MNEKSSTARMRWLALGAALLIGACSATAEAPPLQGARIGGPFALTDQDGHIVRDGDFGGRYRIVYFGYTFCPDACPTDLATIGRALTQFETQAPDRAKRVQPIFITVDPQRDTPAVLKRYVAAFHPRLIGLTGTPAQIAQVSKEFGIAASPQSDVAGSKADYLVDHSRLSFLFGPQGEPIALLPSEEGAKAVEASLERWVK